MVTKLRLGAITGYLVCVVAAAIILRSYMSWWDAVALAIAFQVPLAFALSLLVHWIE